MSDIKIFNISGGAVIMINPPIDYEEITGVKLINKISREDKSSFLFPALYGNFQCEEGELISDTVYESYDALRKTMAYENIFVFEATGKTAVCKTCLLYSINSLIKQSELVITAQNTVKGTDISATFSYFLQSQFYLGFVGEYSFTASEIIILNGLLKYAFLSDIPLENLINDIKHGLENKANIKLLRKEFLNVLRKRLS